MNAAWNSATATVTKMPRTPERSNDFYFDTVTLSNFALAGRTDLRLLRYGQRAMVTEEVPSRNYRRHCRGLRPYAGS